MFGYVTPAVDELKVKEHVLYKGLYCGLCKTMAKNCGESRLTLSYDMVFLALVRLALTNEVPTVRKRRCGFSKRPVIEPCDALRYCAKAGALLAYHNLADNVRDSRGIRKLFSRVPVLLASRMRKKAALPELDALIGNRLSELGELEKQDGATVDMLAECFGGLLSEVFACGLDGTNARIAAEIGFHVGKWIYILDAADDHDKDLKRNEFNPLRTVDTVSLGSALNHELGAAAAAAELIGTSDAGIENLIRNILYLGMPQKADKVLAEYRGTNMGKE